MTTARIYRANKSLVVDVDLPNSDIMSVEYDSYKVHRTIAAPKVYIEAIIQDTSISPERVISITVDKLVVTG